MLGSLKFLEFSSSSSSLGSLSSSRYGFYLGIGLLPAHLKRFSVFRILDFLPDKQSKKQWNLFSFGDFLPLYVTNSKLNILQNEGKQIVCI